MPIAKAQPSRPMLEQMAQGVHAVFGDAGLFTVAAYVPAGEAIPADGSPEAEALPGVRAQLKLLGGAGGGLSQGGRTRVGMSGFSGGTVTPAAGITRQTQAVKVLLACLPRNVTSTPVGGTIDLDDGLGPRVVQLRSGDRLIVPSAEIGREPGSDVILTIGKVDCDGVYFLAEASA